MEFDPMNAVKEFINKSADTASQSFDKVSEDLSKAITPIVQNIKPDIKITIETQSQTQAQAQTQAQTQVSEAQAQQDEINKLVPFEKQFQPLYVGCYSDDPINPSMDTFLGQVSNISECINIGKENNFNYVGIRGGNQCFASNTIPTTQSVDRTKYCNVGCDEIGTGNCGGFFYNQVYRTTLNDMPKLNKDADVDVDVNNLNNSEQEAINILENFITSDSDMKKITMGLNTDNFNCWKPLSSYIIFLWLVILIFLIYLLFEYLYIKNKEKLI